MVEVVSVSVTASFLVMMLNRYCEKNCMVRKCRMLLYWKLILY